MKEQPDSDIDLFDLVLQLWRGKVVIISTVIISVLIGVVYINVVKEKWVSTSTVTLPAAGQVANYNAALSIVYADSPQDKPSLTGLQTQMFNRFTASMSALAGALANLEKPLTLTLRPVKGSDDAVSISFVGQSAKEAQMQLTQYISQVNDEVVKDYGDDIKRNLSVKTRELTNTLDTYKQVALNQKEHRLDVIKQALKIADASNVGKLQVNQAEFLSDDTLYLLGSDALKAMVENENSKPLDFSKEYYDAQRALLAVTHLKIEVDNLQSFRYISQPDLPLKRVSPKKGLALILAFIIGALLGSFIVIGRNSLISYRNRGL
ncbi:LPS O-antigen chain length determinant protein WzzB [Pantoea stewartii subsp. indologenes]|uniref:LPS O-antigen chain length determinant protein WzzB n=1 Tax=Pantoea TaxID=53335 RepID=UPI001FB8B549|nr:MULTISPECIES: LPS O-antigen chain length determinant protein WzzB [Pantoea]